MMPRSKFTWEFFLFSLIIIASILSANFYDTYDVKEGLLSVYLLISFIPLVYVKRSNFNRIYGILAVSCSLIYMTGFGVSWDYIWGYDINGEYFYANKVFSEGYWDTSIAHPYNSVTSVTILAPLISLVLGIDIIYVFKIHYYFLLAFIPIILLKSYEKMFEDKIYVELSVFFFIFFFTYFTEMLALTRQIIAEFFLAMFIYSMITKKLDSISLILLLTGLSLSHYSIAFLMIPPLLLSIVWQYLLKNGEIKRASLYAIIFCTTTIIWYFSCAGGVSFGNLILILHNIISLINEMFSPQFSQGLAIILETTTTTREIAKWINLIAQGLISVGVINTTYTLLRGPSSSKKIREFHVFSFVFYLYCIGGIALPLFASQLNVTRLYHLTLFFLSPFFVLGGKTLCEWLITLPINKRATKSLKNEGRRTLGLAVFLMIYFLFNSGFMLEVTHDSMPPQWLNKFHAPAWSIQERIAAHWLLSRKEINLKIYMCSHKFPLFLGLGEWEAIILFGKEPSIDYEKYDQALVYLGKETVLKGEIQATYLDQGNVVRFKFIPLKATKLGEQLNGCSIVYANEETLIYIYISAEML